MMSIRLRPAIWLDGDMLLDWKNDPVMRRFSIVTRRKIRRRNHFKWLANHIHEIYIIENENGVAVGDIRLEGDSIAIKIDPRFRGLGFGGMAIKLAQKERDHLVAHIVDGNVASMRLFLGNGFKVVDHEKNCYILEWGE